MPTRVRTREWATTDYYVVLGVPPDADPSTIDEAFRALAKSLHPDVNPGDSAGETRFKAVNAAYTVLRDRSTKDAYDAFRAAMGLRDQPVDRPAAPASDWNDGGGGSLWREAPPRPRRARRRLPPWVRPLSAALLVVLAVAAGWWAFVDWSQYRTLRRHTVEVDALVVATASGNRLRFATAAGRTVEARLPAVRHNETAGTRLAVLYRPTDPGHVEVAEDHVPIDLTFGIVAIKLLVGAVVVWEYPRLAAWYRRREDERHRRENLGVAPA